MKTHIKFTNDVFWVGLSQIIIYILGFFTLPALTKTFGAELYGLWAQITVTVGLLTPILTLHLSTATVRYLAAEENKDKLSQAVINMLCIIILLILAVIGISLFIKTNLSMLLFNNTQFSFFITLTFIWAGMEALFAFLISYLRARGKIKKLSFINISFSILKVTSLVILAILGYSLELIIAFIITIELFFIIFLFISIIKEIGFKLPNFRGLKKYLVFSIPQIPSGALFWIIDSSDRYFITNYLNLSQTGIYSASYSIGSLISLFYVPLSFVIFPIVSNFWEQNDIDNVKKYLEYPTKLFLVLSIPAAGGLYILSKPLLLTLTTSEFAVGGTLTFMIALGTIFLGLYQINLYIIYLVEKTKFIPFFISISTIINIILNITLIPNIGIMGAAISTIISYMILAFIVIIWAKRRINYNFDFIFLSKVILSSFLMVFLLKFLAISGIIEIFLAALLGIIIYISCFFILKPFSTAEKKIIIDLFSSLKSHLNIKLKKS